MSGLFDMENQLKYGILLCFAPRSSRKAEKLDSGEALASSSERKIERPTKLISSSDLCQVYSSLKAAVEVRES